MIDSQLTAFIAVAALLTITPGADTLLVVRNTLRGGRPDGWTTILGIASGCTLHATFSAIGISVILATSAVAFHAVKLAGAAYLVWLGVQSIRGARRTAAAHAPDRGATPAVRRRRSYAEGFITNILNPKVAVFYLAFLPQFMSPDDPVLAKSLFLASLHILMGVAWLGGVTVAVSKGRRWMEQPGMRADLARVTGAALVAMGVRLALEKR